MVKPSRIADSSWTLWYDVKPENGNGNSGYYGDRLHEVCSLEGIQSAPEYAKFMKKPETIPRNTNLYVFRGKSKPMWELYPDGGCWSYKLPRENPKLEVAWTKLLECCQKDGIGSENVAGIAVNSRAKEVSINVWLISGQSSALRFEILDRLREILDLHEGETLQYKDFQAAVKDDSSKVNAVTYRVKGAGERAIPKKYILPDPVTGSFTFNLN